VICKNLKFKIGIGTCRKGTRKFTGIMIFKLSKNNLKTQCWPQQKEESLLKQNAGISSFQRKYKRNTKNIWKRRKV